MAFLFAVAPALAADRILWFAVTYLLSAGVLYRTDRRNLSWETAHFADFVLSLAPMSDGKPVYCTPKRAAEYLEVTDETIRRWLREKKLRGVKVVGTWRVYLSAVHEMLNPK